jgi:hypothetical protein
LGEAEALDVKRDAWNEMKVGDASVQVRYCSKGTLDRHTWGRILDEIKPQVLHLNSMFSKEHTLIPMRLTRKRGGMRVVLAPRGMLGSAALSIKPLKKRVFLSVARMLDLFKEVTWHASTLNESKEVQMHFHPAHVRIAQNLPTSLPPTNPARASDRWRIVVILVCVLCSAQTLLGRWNWTL